MLQSVPPHMHFFAAPAGRDSTWSLHSPRIPSSVQHISHEIFRTHYCVRRNLSNRSRIMLHLPGMDDQAEISRNLTSSSPPQCAPKSRPFKQSSTPRNSSSARSASAKYAEDWSNISDSAERRRMQNRNSQRKYRGYGRAASFYLTR